MIARARFVAVLVLRRPGICLPVGSTLLFFLWSGSASAQQRQVEPAELLEQVRSVARQSSPEVGAAAAEVAAAQGRLRASGFGLPAVLSAEVEEVGGGFGFDGPVPLRLMLEKTFLAPGEGDALRAVSEVEVAGAVARLEAAEQRVQAGAEAALVSAVGWASLSRRLVEEDSLLSATEASLRTRFASADARYVDVIRLRTERLRVEASLATALSESRVARTRLEAIVPREDPEGASVLSLVDDLIGHAATAEDVDLLSFLLPAPDVDSLLGAAGAVRVGRVGVRLAQARRLLLQASQRPGFSAYLGGERTAGDGGGAVYGPVAGISLTLPFTARRGNAMARAAARLEEAAAEEGLRSVTATLRAELMAARGRYEAALAQVRVFDAALLRAARLEREGALAGYRSGQLSLTELLDFQRGLLVAETARIESQIAVAQARADLVTAAYATSDSPSPAGSSSVGSGS